MGLAGQTTYVGAYTTLRNSGHKLNTLLSHLYNVLYIPSSLILLLLKYAVYVDW